MPYFHNLKQERHVMKKSYHICQNIVICFNIFFISHTPHTLQKYCVHSLEKP